MDAEERELFAKGVADLVARSSGTDLDRGLQDVGWADALGDDPRAAVTALFEAQGRVGRTSGALDLVIGAALGRSGPLEGPPPAVVLPALGRTGPPGRREGDEVVVDGLATSALARADALVLVVAVDGGANLVTAAVGDLDGLERRPIEGLDPRLGLVQVRGRTPVSPTPVAAARWDDAVAAGQVALAHELVGASRAMLELARGHALERIQFGGPIAGFQAVRHRLADALVAIESAAAALDAAWDEPGPLTASLAKALAGRGSRVVAKHCQQVLAGIGFTAEHPFHGHLRRARVLDGLLGDARSLTRSLGEQLLRDRAVPELLPL